MLTSIPRVTCIIINFQTPEHLVRLVSRLKEDSLHVVVVDNSIESTPDEVKKDTPPSYRYLRNATNTGFAAAANRGARTSGVGDWFLFLNPDTHMSRSILDDFVGQAEAQGLDACCPHTSDSRYTHPLPSVWWFLSEFTPLKSIPFVRSQAQKQPLTLWGGCLLIRKTVFQKLGGFDERFFLWFEDSDLTKRLITNGYKVGREGVEGLKHVGGASFEGMPEKEKKKIFFKSACMYVTAHGTWYDRLVVQVIRLRYGVFF